MARLFRPGDRVIHVSLGPGVVREMRSPEMVLVRFRSEYDRPYSAMVHTDALRFVARAVRDKTSRDPGPMYQIQRFSNGAWVTVQETRDLHQADRRRAALRARGSQARVREKGTGIPRDPDDKANRNVSERRKRPYERYAARTMSKLALRRLALQSIGRPHVARGLLHDALLEMYPVDYQRAIDKAHEMASADKHSYAVLFLIGEMSTWRRETPPLWVVPNTQHDTKQTMWGRGPQVVTYIARLRKRKS